MIASETLSGAVGEMIKGASQHYPNKETQDVADAATNAPLQGSTADRVKNLLGIRVVGQFESFF